MWVPHFWTFSPRSRHLPIVWQSAVKAKRLSSSSKGASVYTAAFFRSEADFVDALRAARSDAQAELFRRHHVRVAEVLERVLGPDDDLPDLVQEVFVRGIAGAPRFRGTSEALEAWLVKIAIHTARGLIRRRRVWRRFFSMAESPPDIPSPGQATHEQIEAVRRAYAIFDKLPTGERVALTLEMIDEMPLLQIAESCGVSRSTIKRTLNRARQRFRTLVELDPALRDLNGGGGT
jgi:RNA polymerase sigma-70 factor, ECF subfamily